MSHLIQIRQRIKSIQTTEKVTHAMRLISMSLYSRLDKQQSPLNYHTEALEDIFRYLVRQCPEWRNKTFFPDDILDQNPLFIIISSTKGFCGGLNNNLFRYLEYKLHVEEHQTPNFITVGKKATNFITGKNFGTVLASYNDLNSNNYPDIALNIAQAITSTQIPYTSATIFSTVFKNFFVQSPITNQIIPFDQGFNTNLAPEAGDGISPIWEQNSIETLNFIANRYLNTQLTNILFQALVSEYASRFVAMDSATTNAENYLEELKLQFNKMRQALITREVSELSSSL